jgi:Acyl-CoA thioester hydrolase/BAAT N-terminal region
VIKLAVAALLTITPASTLVDGTTNVRVTGVAAHARVTLAATTVDARGRRWSSRVLYRADAHGAVRVGSGRLLTSMTTSAGHVPFWLQPRPTPVRVTALVGGHVVGRATFERSGRAGGVTERDTTLAADGFLGKYFAPPPTMSAVARPGVLLLGGSGGGYADPDLAALLASHGYPALALAYFGEPGLPATLSDIPLQYFGNALQWLGAQPGVPPHRLAVIGVSRGGEAAILAGLRSRRSYPPWSQRRRAATSSAASHRATHGRSGASP